MNETINKAIKMFSDNSDILGLRILSNAASGTMESVKEITNYYAVNVIEFHRRLDVNISLKAPRLFIPQNWKKCSKNHPQLVIDLGHFSIKSILIR